MQHEKNRIFGLSCGGMVAVALAAFALNAMGVPGDPPHLISFEGYLVDLDGNPLGTDEHGASAPANFDVQFSVYDSATGGTLLWREEQTIAVDSGYFSVYLGEGSPVDVLPAPPFVEVFSGVNAAERYVGTAVRFLRDGDYLPILPRLRMASSPYALVSGAARSLLNEEGERLVTLGAGDVVVTGELWAHAPVSVQSISGDGADLNNLNASALASGTIHSDRIPGLDASKIVSGLVDLARLPPVTVSSVPDLPASKITSGTLHHDRIPGLNANKITSGVLTHYQIHGLPADKINSGQFHPDRIPFEHHRNWKIEHGQGPAFTLTDQSHYRAGHGYFRRLHGRIDVGGWGLHHADHERHASYHGDNTWHFYSDLRVKQDVVDIEPLLDRAMQVQVRRYRWQDQDESAPLALGVIAQEVQPLFPDLVTETPYDVAGPESEEPVYEDYLMVAYDDFGLVAIKGLQEMHDQRSAEIAELSRMIEKQDEEIAELSRLIGQLKVRME